MLDGYYKATTDRFWNFLATGLVRAGLSPNQVTIIGLALVVANCALYVVHESTLWFGILLALSFAFDGLDGAVARITDRTSKFGGYLDAGVRHINLVFAGGDRLAQLTRIATEVVPQLEARLA